jgi:hypothetical protein
MAADHRQRLLVFVHRRSQQALLLLESIPDSLNPGTSDFPAAEDPVRHCLVAVRAERIRQQYLFGEQLD